METISVVGGGLAGAEAAWQAAQRGWRVRLFEMRPARPTGAHQTGDLAELVCSNSLGATVGDRAPGLLKAEVERLGSLLLRCARQTALPAGGALAVDRQAFGRAVTEAIQAHPRIEIVRQEVTAIPSGPTIIASGPLTSPALTQALVALTGQEHLYFFDAIAPVVVADSIDTSIAFRASRFAYDPVTDTVSGDYLNCPLTEAEYQHFVTELLAAERIALASFDAPLEHGVTAGAPQFFEGCLPVEVLARRGREALAFGPLRPIGLRDPRTGQRPYAVVQLRQDNLAASLYNLVGFQTNLTFPEQRRVLRLIPGLEHAEFARYGQMHRNTFIFAPAHLDASLQYRGRPDLFFAGQITGVEGYVGNIATGLLAGWNLARVLAGQAPLTLPTTTLLGALCHYISHAAPADFQPMKANFGLLPPLDDPVRGKRSRGGAHAARAAADLTAFLAVAGSAQEGG